MLCLLLIQSLALTGGTVHSMVPGEAPRIATVLVEDGKIAAIGDSLELPADCQQVDLSGLHLVPGLIDGSVNHDSDHDVLYIASGITLVRDTGNDLSRILAERDPAARERNPGPELFLPGLPLDGNPPATTSSLVLTELEGAALNVQRFLSTVHPDYLLYAEGLPAEIWRALGGWADEAQLDLWGPVPTGASLEEVLAAKQAGLMSLQSVLPTGVGWHQIEDAAVLEPQIDMLAGGQTALTPLLMVYGRMLKSWNGEVNELLFLGPHYRQSWAGELRSWRDRMTPELRQLTERALQLEEGALSHLVQRGVRILPGSGAPNAGLLPGVSLLDELDLMAQAGIEPYEVLRMATRGAAQILGLDAERGSLEVGKQADIAVLGLDPQQGLRALRELELLVLRGKLYEGDELNERLERLKARQKERFLRINQPVDVPSPDVPEGDLLMRGRAEIRSEGVRISSETFAVVKTPTDDTVYATRIYNQETATTGGTEVTLRQTLREGRLVEFDMAVRGIGQEYTITGRLLGGLMNVEARGNGKHLYGTRAKQPIEFVDVGGALSAVMAGQKLVPELDNFVLGFDDLDPVVHRWRLRIAPDDHQFIVDAGIGLLWYGFGANGAPVFSMRQQGTGQTEVRFLETDTLGGPGLPLPPARCWIELEPSTEDH